MIDLLICNQIKAMSIVTHSRVIPHLLSISNPERPAFEKKPLNVDHYLALGFHDIEKEEGDLIPPQKAHIDQIVEWSHEYQQGFVIIHCVAGMSRSTAAALIFLCEQGERPDKAMEYVTMMRPYCLPNRLILQLYGNEELILKTRSCWDLWDKRIMHR